MNRLIATALTLAAFTAAGAQNPYMPLWEHIPDSEPYVFDDPDNPGKKRVYIYGSHDNLRDKYCGLDQVVWSAPVDDLTQWRYDGVIFTSERDRDGRLLHADGKGDLLFAPDVAVVNEPDGTKTYYLYPNNQEEGRKGMVAKSKRPDGPFEVCNWSTANAQETDGVLRFDPAVFVDDDNRVYGYWGFTGSFGAELDPATMATVKPGTEIVEDMVSNLGQDGVFRFFEASSIRKIKDKYVFVYSRWTPDGDFGLYSTNYTLAYAYSDKPLGPWTYGGTIIDGRGRETLPDGRVVPTASLGGNTHGSICEINGQWYVFYHRQCGPNEYARQAMVAPITVKVTEGAGGKVEISEAEYTSEGFATGGLALKGVYPAGIASHYTGKEWGIVAWQQGYLAPFMLPTYYEGDPKNAPSDIELKSCPVVNIVNGSKVGYKYFNFDTAGGKDKLDMTLTLKPLGHDATVTVYAGRPYIEGEARQLGRVGISKDDSQTAVTKKLRLSGLKGLKGKLPLFFVFTSDTDGQSLCDFYSFSFGK